MSGARGVFLDRDGTIVEDPGFLSDPDDVRLLPGAAAAIARLNAAGLPVVVVTNQSGIARGLYGESDYLRVAARIAELLEAEGARLDLQLHCPHHPDVSGPCDCRKPGPALYERAARQLDLDLSASWFVGDRLRDLEAARRFGGHAVHVQSGSRLDDDAVAEGGYPSVASLREAVERILR